MSSKLKRKKKDVITVGQFRQAAHSMDAKLEKNMKKYEEEIKEATQKHYMGLMYCVFLLVIRKICNFGPKRTLRLLGEMAAIINDLGDGTISVFDIKREAEEAGIRVVFDSQYDIIKCGIFEEEKYKKVQKKVDQERMDFYEKLPMPGQRLWTNPEFEDKLAALYATQQTGGSCGKVI